MSTRRPDPSLMMPEERLQELGGLLATGFRRHLLNLEKSLADAPQNEAQCGRPVDAESGGKEVA